MGVSGANSTAPKEGPPPHPRRRACLRKELLSFGLEQINQQLRLFSIQIADLLAASVASFSVLVGGCQTSLAMQE
jgi:hypothetical protein